MANAPMEFDLVINNGKLVIPASPLGLHGYMFNSQVVRT